MCTGQFNMEIPIISSQPFWCAANAEEELKHSEQRFHYKRKVPQRPESLRDSFFGKGSPLSAAQTVSDHP